MNLTDTETWSLARVGFLYYLHRRLEDAAALFGGLTELRPDHAYGWYALGLVRREMGDFRGAVEALNQAVSVDGAMWPARLALAELLYDSGYVDDARAVLEPADAPNAPDVREVQRGRVLLERWG